MKIRKNSVDDTIIYLEHESEREREVLKDMWDNGVQAFGWGRGLAITSKRLFGQRDSEFTPKGD